MQDATFLPQTGFSPVLSSKDMDSSSFSVYDDPQEWAVFSHPCDSSPETAGQWESQVKVQGMHCAACSLMLEQALLGVRGVVSAHVSAASARASVTWSAALTRPSEWLAAPNALVLEGGPEILYGLACAPDDEPADWWRQ